MSSSIALAPAGVVSKLRSTSASRSAVDFFFTGVVGSAMGFFTGVALGIGASWAWRGAIVNTRRRMKVAARMGIDCAVAGLASIGLGLEGGALILRFNV